VGFDGSAPALHTFGGIWQPLVSPERKRAGGSIRVCSQTIGRSHSLHRFGKSRFGNFVKNQEAKLGYPSLAIWARRTESNLPVAERVATTSPDKHCRRQGAKSMEDAPRPEPMERKKPDISGNCRSNGRAMERAF
jgi:hypothetical protein